MAVYTEVSDAALSGFLKRYGVGEARSFKGIAEGVENSNYLLETEKGRFILTLYEKRVAEADLPFFLGLMDHLAAKGVPCPRPVHMNDGKRLGQLEGRPAALIEFLEGMSITRPKPAHCKAVGEALAGMHLAGGDFGPRRDNALGQDAWRGLFETCRQDADTVIAGLRGTLETELDFLDRHWPQGLPSGVVHADLFPDNVFFLGETLSGLIDFYFACNDAFAYDVGICLNAWCFESDGAFNITKARALLNGYRALRPPETAEIEALPVLCRGSAVRFLLTRLFDLINHVDGALVKPKDPGEYLKRLRFHQTVESAEAYGLDL